MDGPVVEIHMEWTEHDVQHALVQQTKVVEWSWQKALKSNWLGVEILDMREHWLPCTGACLESLHRQWRSKQEMPTEWQVQQGECSHLHGHGPLIQWREDQWMRLAGLTAFLGASPAQSNRIVRNWPEESARARGRWFAFATVREGVHAIGYYELLASGISPDTLDASALRLFGNGGQALPLDNNTDRPLDMVQQRVWRRGLEDGSFDPGDGLYWYAPPHETWEWTTADGWVHTPALWGDTAKWFLRVDADSSVPLLDIETNAPVDGEVDEVRTQHVLYGVQEEHTYNLIRSGRNWFGERLSALGVTSTTWDIPIPHAVLGGLATVRFGAAIRTKGSGSASQLTYTFEGESQTLLGDIIPTESQDHAEPVSGELSAPMTIESIQVLAEFDPGTDNSSAWIDHLAFQAPQNLVFDGGQMVVNGLPIDASGEPVDVVEYQVQGEAVDAIWDVTNPHEVAEVAWSVQGNGLAWRDHANAPKKYLAFRRSGALRPEAMGAVGNSNIHGVGEVDYVIVTNPVFQNAADSLASIHASRGLRVAVVLQQDIFDGFSSGVSDPTAVKMLMMMLQDRAVVSGGEVDPPKYLLLFGDATFRNRNLQTDGIHVVCHYSEQSLVNTTSYTSDDYFVLTSDGQSERPTDLLQFGVGRIPATSIESADVAVSKIATYLNAEGAQTNLASCLEPNGTSVFGPWRNRVLFVSDDQDGNVMDNHRYMENSESHSQTIRNNHNDFDIVKIYPDAYVQTNTPGGERYDDATAEIARRVDEGALIVNYIGHGGERGWAHERILNMETIESWSNLTRLPVFMTATCELFRHDDPDIYSAGEAILFNPDGGAIALLTTTRTVYSLGNQQVNSAFFETALIDEPGRCLGDIYKDTKNSDLITSSTNARNFSLMGDPALELAYPEEHVYLTQVPDTLKSLEEVVIQGYVGLANGDTLTDFNGVVIPTVFDKPSTITTLDNDQSVEGPFTYQTFQNILHKGLASVVNGQFEFKFIVPRDIDYTVGNGRISLYALSDDRDAHGHSEDFYIGGVSDDPVVDTDGPNIQLYMNDTLFKAGDVVHEDPWLLVHVQDESGLNTSGNGIGHDAKAVLNGDASNPYVLNEYFISDLDTYQSGTIRFPFQDLEEGRHELEVKVWDVANNSATEVTDFVVASSLDVALVEVLAYPNPAVDAVTFRMTGNQACREAQVMLEVFDPRGNKVYDQEFEGEVLGFRDDVMTWNLKPQHGGVLSDGIYVFRVTWVNENGSSAQYADKLVVLRSK